MLKLEWNALRSGDHVLVHDPDAAHLDLVKGVVLYVDVLPFGNDVSVRIDRHGIVSVVRPSRLSVHLDPLGPDDECWRCGEQAVVTSS